MAAVSWVRCQASGKRGVRPKQAAVGFRPKDDPISRDFDFTPGEGWTAQAFKAKKQNLASVLDELHGGLGPELLGVCEVEGDDVFEDLLAETGADYRSDDTFLFNASWRFLDPET
jgi:Endonuclease/Exonuclease/phosphatase family